MCEICAALRSGNREGKQEDGELIKMFQRTVSASNPESLLAAKDYQLRSMEKIWLGEHRRES